MKSTSFRRLWAGPLLACAALPVSVTAQETAPQAQESVQVTAAQLFEFAEQAKAQGDFATAATAYEALANDPDQSIRSEARFRHAIMLADRQGRYADAAVLFRRILDDEPDQARVRLELARMQAMLGNRDEAARELRAVQTADLPPQVARQVRFYQQALSGRKPFGASIELALAPDSNINRATQSDTLGTIIGDFDLSEDAQETSGIGLSARAQTYGRVGLRDDTDLLLRLSGSGRAYEKSQFNDYSLALQAGPEMVLGKAWRVDLAALGGLRWFGGELYSRTLGVTSTVTHAVDPRTQLRLQGSATQEDDRLNNLRDARRAQLSLGLDRAFSQRSGGGVRLSGDRRIANDPGYSTASGGIDLYAFREIGRTTAVVRGGYERLEADRRLFLYPERRKDDRFDISLSGTFRALTFEGLAPLLRVSYERNLSTVEIYDYQRVAAEIGITAAF